MAWVAPDDNDERLDSMDGTPQTLVRQLEANTGRGRTVTIRQQVNATFAGGAMDELVFTAKRMGLKATVESGRGWIKKPYLFTITGDVDEVLRWYRVFMSVAEQ